ncbi:50S ribosomal protein L23 [Candidatus Daviesbacteria bacterium]|nr:50S ribosomal protein L23 [Candidatus Daviesbacteria bacterium]
MLKRPYISEKSMILVKSNFYTFEVAKTLTKLQIAKLVKDKFKVDVVDVRVINIHGKFKNQRTKKGQFKTKGIKKALVKIKKGQKIALFEAAPEEKEVKVTTGEGEQVTSIKEKKSLLKGTKVKIEKETKKKAEK